jgi:hypothetical protein
MHVVCHGGFGTLVAVVDGLGHGREALAAARLAVDTISGLAGLPLPSLLERCHDALTATRGVAMTVASVADTGRLDWVGVGNVDAVVVRAAPGERPREHVMLWPGIVGYGSLPTLHASTVYLRSGDLLAMATDGIRAGFATDLDPAQTPEALTARIHARYALGNDDALVVVAQFRGALP